MYPAFILGMVLLEESVPRSAHRLFRVGQCEPHRANFGGPCVTETFRQGPRLSLQVDVNHLPLSRHGEGDLGRRPKMAIMGKVLETDQSIQLPMESYLTLFSKTALLHRYSFEQGTGRDGALSNRCC